MITDRRRVLAALGLGVPLSLAHGVPPRPDPAGRAVLQFRSFEDALREAFAYRTDHGCVCRIEVGHSELLSRGVQGCRNDLAFAGFPAGALRIVRSACEPGPAVKGVRLMVATVDVVLGHRGPGRLLDFSLLLPSATLVSAPEFRPAINEPFSIVAPRPRRYVS